VLLLELAALPLDHQLQDLVKARQQLVLDRHFDGLTQALPSPPQLHNNQGLHPFRVKPCYRLRSNKRKAVFGLLKITATLFQEQ
jgi:hypothetical protein